MSVYIQNIECLVPETSYSQAFIREKMKGWLKGSRRVNRYLDRIYKNSGIDKRHSVITDPDGFFHVSGDGRISVPTTKYRNDLFTSSAKKMFVALAEQTIRSCENANFGKITHVITVSCTGFFNPGPDYEIIRKLNLKNNVQRFNIGFMGCHGAFPALRLAHAICQADPSATVLIVAVELCTLHAQLGEDLDSILGGAIFADGGAGVVVSAAAPLPGQKVFKLNHFESALIPDSETDMAWTIGDTGFEMTLSQNVPKIIGRNISEILSPILAEHGITVSDIQHWAVHPGGKSILDRIEKSLNIGNCLEESRSVLRQYGNISSATILFVLKEMLQKPCKGPDESVLAMAFGPGLTMEACFLSKHATPPQYEDSKRLTASRSSVSGTTESRLRID